MRLGIPGIAYGGDDRPAVRDSGIWLPRTSSSRELERDRAASTERAGASNNRFRADSRNAFEVSVTPTWEEVPAGPAAEERSMRERVEKYLEGVKPSAVE